MTALPAAAVTQPVAGPTAVATKVPEDISGAEAFKDVVTQQSDTVGGLIAWLDAFGFTVGETRISAWNPDDRLGVRLSIGLEDPEDLMCDLERGFAAMARP